MSIAVDIDKAKEIAEQYMDAKADAAFLKKQLGELFEGSDVEITEILPNGATLSYKVVQPKEKFDYVAYANFLAAELKKGSKYSEEELNSFRHNFTVQKISKWTLKVTK